MSASDQAAAMSIHRVDMAGQIRYELRRPDGSVVGHYLTIAAAECAAVSQKASELMRAAIARAAKATTSTQ